MINYHGKRDRVRLIYLIDGFKATTSGNILIIEFLPLRNSDDNLQQ